MVTLEYIKKRGFIEYLVLAISLISTPLLFAAAIGGGRFVEYNQSSFLYDLSTPVRIVCFFGFLLMAFIFLVAFVYQRKGQINISNSSITWNNSEVFVNEIKYYKVSRLPRKGKPLLQLKFIDSKSKQTTFNLIGEDDHKNTIVSLLGKERFNYGLI